MREGVLLLGRDRAHCLGDSAESDSERHHRLEVMRRETERTEAFKARPRPANKLKNQKPMKYKWDT